MTFPACLQALAPEHCLVKTDFAKKEITMRTFTLVTYLFAHAPF